MATKLKRAKQKIGNWRKEYITAKAERRKMLKQLRMAVDVVPTNWCDSLLSGPSRVIGDPPYSGIDIEKLLLAVKARLEDVCNTTGEPRK